MTLDQRASSRRSGGRVLHTCGAVAPVAVDIACEVLLVQLQSDKALERPGSAYLGALYVDRRLTRSAPRPHQRRQHTVNKARHTRQAVRKGLPPLAACRRGARLMAMVGTA